MKHLLHSIIFLNLLISPLFGDSDFCYGYGYTPPVVLDDECCNWSGEINYLYLKAMNNLFIADKIIIVPQRQNVASRNDIKELKFDWDSGIEIGISYQIPCDCWSIGLSWTSYRTSNSVSYKAPFISDDFNTVDGSEFVMPLQGMIIFEPARQPEMIGSFSKYSAQASITYNQVDLIASRESYLGKCLAIKPMLGLRCILLNQNLESDFELGGTPSASSKIQHKCTHFGVMGGFETFWAMNCGLGLYGNISGSLLYASHNNKGSNNEINARQPELNPIIGNQSYCYNDLVSTLECGMGLKFNQSFDCDRSQFSLKLGWELFQINNQDTFVGNMAPNNNVVGALSVLQKTSLGFHGVILGVSISM